MINKKTKKCPLCKKNNPQNINFCKYCRYPINIKKIDAFTKEDLVICFSNLIDVIEDKKPLFNHKIIDEAYNELISLNWLRPESAIFRFVEAQILLKFKNKYLKYPILDLGCGDGLFTSILFGARINKDYDAYESIDFSKIDIYDNYKRLPKKFFIKKPSPIGFGIDIKKNAVKKAKELEIYDDVKEGDIRKLPFDDKSVNSVFSNMIDDIKKEDLSKVFKEVNRVLKNNGYFIFTTPTENFRKFLFYYNKAQYFKKQGDINKYNLFLNLDRGRSEWESRSLSLWMKIFKETSFKLIEYIEYGNKNMFQFWDTGFRPFFLYLVNFKSILRKNYLYLPVKKIWVELVKNYFLKYAKNQISKKGSFAIIVVKKIK